MQSASLLARPKFNSVFPSEISDSDFSLQLEAELNESIQLGKPLGFSLLIIDARIDRTYSGGTASEFKRLFKVSNGVPYYSPAGTDCL